MPKRRINNFPKAVLDRKLEVDGKETTMRDFVKINFYQRSNITPNESNSVVDLEPGESVTIRAMQIKRLT
jgi:hypothetical protein